jgi:hypothetical protein
MFQKKILKLGLIVLIVGVVVSLIGWYAYAQALSTERKQVLLSTSFKIGAGEEKFKVFYLSTPCEIFYFKWNVSQGSIKASHPWQASEFEDDLGYVDVYVNETKVEKIHTWFWNENNATIGGGVEQKDMNQVWYLQFYNEDSYEKEVYLEVTKVWHGFP